MSGNAVRREAIWNVEAYVPPAVSFNGDETPGEIFGEIRPASTMVVVAGLVDHRWKVEVELDAVVPD